MGIPGRRYYGGCEVIDQIKELAIERTKSLFGARWANVQPHSGSQANAAVLLALAEAGDTLLGMRLDMGGHLTHGSPVNFTGKLYRSVQYRVNADEMDIDYDHVAEMAQAEKPKVLIGGFSAYSGIVDWQRLRQIADSVGAYFWVDMAHIAGLVAAGIYPSPIPHAHVVTSTTHKTLRGARGGIILSNQDDPQLHAKLDSAVCPGIQGGPLEHVVAAKAVTMLEAAHPQFKEYQQQVVANAQALYDGLQNRGLQLIGPRSQNHIVLLDLRQSKVSGKRAERWLDQAHLTTNKNAVPNDHRKPLITSGIRMGSAACTTRGFGPGEMDQIAGWIERILTASAELGAEGDAPGHRSSRQPSQGIDAKISGLSLMVAICLLAGYFWGY